MTCALLPSHARMSSRLLRAALLLVVAVPLAFCVAGKFASDETRIRRLLRAEAAAFNSASALSALTGFARDYRDETSGLDRPALQAALLWAFQNRRDGEGRFRLRVELPADALQVEVRDKEASATFRLALWERNGDDEALEWELSVQARLEHGEYGWRIVSSRHETVQGKPPR